MFLWEITGKQVDCGRRVLLPELRQIAHGTNIKARRLGKVDLAKELQRHFAALRIWIAWKARQIDPITLDRPEPPIFKFFQSNGKATNYTARVLIDYLLSSNRFVEPLSNTEFSQDQLAELDKICKANNWDRPSLVQRKSASTNSTSQVNMNFVLEVELLERADLLAASLPMGNFFRHLRELALVYVEFHQRDPAAARLGLAAAIEKVRSSVDTEHPNAVNVLAALYDF